MNNNPNLPEAFHPEAGGKTFSDTIIYPDGDGTWATSIKENGEWIEIGDGVSRKDANESALTEAGFEECEVHGWDEATEYGECQECIDQEVGGRFPYSRQGLRRLIGG